MIDTEHAEDLFDDVTDWFAREIAAARGDSAREAAVCRTAVERYAEAKRLVDPEGAFENVTHFFGADGIGFERARTPALRKVGGLSADEGARICQILGDIAMELETASLA